MIAAGTAAMMLSEAARAEALVHGNYLCYEEDCAIEIPLFENAEIRNALFSEQYLESVGGIDEVLKRMHLNLSTYYVDYLEAIGVTPDVERRKMHDARKAFDKARIDAPETVFTCCKGEWDTLLEGVQKVYDGTGKGHYATTASLTALRESSEKHLLSRMADIEVVEAAQLPAVRDRLVPFIDYIRRTYEANDNLDNLGRAVGFMKDTWFSLVKVEHNWSKGEAAAFLQQNLAGLRHASGGMIADDELQALHIDLSSVRRVA